MFSRLENIKLGKMFEDDPTNINDVEKALSLVNIAIRDTENSFRPMGDVFDEVAQKWSTMNELEQSAVANAIAGIRQRENFLTLMSNYNQVLKAQTLETEAAGLANERYGIYLEGLEAKINTFKATWEELWMKTISSDFIKSIIDAGTNVTHLITQLGGILPVMTAIIGLVVFFKRESITAFGINIIKNIGSFITSLKITEASLTAVATKAEAVALAVNSIFGVIGLAVMAIGVSTSVLNKKIADIKELGNLSTQLDEINSSISELDSKISSIEDSVKTISDLKTEFDKLSESTVLSTDEQERWLEIQNELKDIIPSLNGSYDDEGNFLISNTSLLDTYVGLKKEELEILKEKRQIELNQRIENLTDQVAQAELVRDATEQTVSSWGLLLKSLKGLPTSDEIYVFDIEKNKEVLMSVGDATQYYTDKLEKQESALEISRLSFRDLTNQLELARTELEILSDEVPIEPTVDPDDESVMSIEDIIAASEKLDTATKEATSSAISGYETLKSVLESYNDTNVVTIDQAQKLIDAGYGEAVSINQLTGEVSINAQMLRQLAIAKADAAIVALQNQLAIWQETTAIESQEKDLVNNINLWRQRKAAIEGSSANTVDLLKAISGFSGGITKAASGSSSAIDKITESRKKAYEAEIKGYEAQKKALDNQKKALEKQKDAYKDIIDAMKEKLKLQKEESDFQSELEDKNKELADIDKELLELQFDNSEEAKAKRLQLEADKAEKIEEITQFQADRTYDIQMDALDAEYEAYAKMIDQQLAGIDAIISGFDAMIAKINELIDALGKLASAGGGTSGATYTKATIISSTPTSVTLSSGQKITIPYIRKHHEGGLVESHHDGDFAGSLKSNEVFSKLLKGEYVSTEAQMKNFLSDILPRMMIGSNAMIQNKSGNGDISINMPITIEGNADESLLPKIKNMVSEVIYEGMKNKGYRRNVNSYGNV